MENFTYNFDIVALDVSLTNAGIAWLRHHDKTITLRLVSSSSDNNEQRKLEMVERLKTVIGGLLDINKRTNIRTVFVIESFTDTLIKNDRTGSAILIRGIVDELTQYIRGIGANASVHHVLPWSWKKWFGLPSKVSTNVSQLYSIARNEGHDLMKQMSVKTVSLLTKRNPSNAAIGFVNNNKYIPTQLQNYTIKMHTTTRKDGITLDSDDLAEALLILIAFSHIIPTNNHALLSVDYYNTFNFERALLNPKNYNDMRVSHTTKEGHARYGSLSNLLQRAGVRVSNHSLFHHIVNDNRI